MTLHAFAGGGSRCTYPYPAGPFGRCGNPARSTAHYLSKADLYRAAVAGQPLPDTFVISLRFWLIEDATMVEVPGQEYRRSDVFTTALRSAISLAQDWRDIATASRELGHEDTSSTAPKDQFFAGLFSGQNHQATYCANMLLRTIARGLYGYEVPEEERYG